MVMTLAGTGRWRVWLGASMALVVQAALAVVAGVVVARLFGSWIHWAEAAAFGAFAVYLWREAGEEEAPARPGPARSPLVRAFLLVFLAEFGDLTQFSIVAWSARLNPPWAVLGVSAAALAAAAAVSANLGGYLAKRLTLPRLKRLSAFVFLAMAAVMMAG
jgi:putative Ca2+/H+ antiporter (TMEM165/GDT1 family)